MKRPDPPPCIDLAGEVQVIDAGADPPRWRTLERVPVASEEHARRVARKHGLRSVWLRDDLGCRKLVTA